MDLFLLSSDTIIYLVRTGKGSRLRYKLALDIRRMVMDAFINRKRMR